MAAHRRRRPRTAPGPTRGPAALDPVALPGGYPNLLGPDDDARARDSFGANLDRLLAAKRRYDPDNVFSAIPALLD